LPKFQHIFHVNYIDPLIEKYEVRTTLKVLESSRILGFFLKYFSITQDHMLVCGYCFKRFSSESLVMLKTNFVYSNSDLSDNLSEEFSGWMNLKGAEVLKNRFVVNRNEIILANPNYNQQAVFISDWWRYLYFNKNSTNFAITGNSDVKNESLSEAIFPISSNHNNWFHFVFEGILNLLKLPEIFFELPVLLPKNMGRHFSEILNLINFKNIHLMDPNTTYNIESLYFPVTQTWISDVPLTRFTKVDFNLDFLAIKSANQYFLELSNSFNSSIDLLSSKIAILRNPSTYSNRILINYQEIGREHV
jgi:hypothetical protein